MHTISKRLIKFLVTGTTSAIVEYGVFLTLVHIELSLLLANSISFSCGLFVSYSLNRVWVFRSNGQKKKEFVKYGFLALINLALSNGLIYVEVHFGHVYPALAKLVAMIAVAAWNYYIFPRLIFKKYD